MGMLMHHTWQEQQKMKPAEVVEEPIEEPVPEVEHEEKTERKTTATRKTGGRRKVSK